MQGRIEGRKSDDGTAYELRQAGELLRSTPIDDAKDDKKLAAAIRKNGWGQL